MTFECSECCAKSYLIIVNGFFQILGVILIVAGIVVKTGWPVIENSVMPLLGLSDQSTAESSTGDTSTSIIDSVPEILSDSAYVFIAFGLFIMVAGFIGCIGACCKIRNLLIIYISVVAVALLAKLIFLLLLVTAKLDDSIKSSLKDKIKKSYGGISDTTLASLSLNMIMVKYSCCGVDSYEEFVSATNWDRSYQIEYDGEIQNVTLHIPVACCKMTGSFPSMSLITPNCTWDPNSNNSNMDTNCWDSVVSELKHYEIVVISSYAAVLFFEALCICVAIYMLLRTVKDEKAGRINPWTD